MDREGTRRMASAVMPDSGTLVMEANSPEGRRFWLTDEMLPKDRQGRVKPTFPIATVAKVFFARSADWIRWLDGKNSKNSKSEDDGGIFVLDGEPLEIKRTSSGNRTWTLVDVERLAHALLQHNKITGQQFSVTMHIVCWMAYAYGMLADEDMISAPTPTHVGEQLTFDYEREAS